MDLTNVKSGAMSRTGGSGTGGSGTGGSARAEEVHERRKCKSRGSARAEGGRSSRSWIYQPELGYVADKAKGVAGLKPE